MEHGVETIATLRKPLVKNCSENNKKPQINIPTTGGNRQRIKSKPVCLKEYSA